MAERPVAQGYFALLRWRLDPTRDEARNVAVLLVHERGRFGGLRHAPVSSVSPRLREQGIVDDVLLGLQEKFSEGFRLKNLRELNRSLQRALVVTEPKRVAVPDPDEALDALYRAYVAPRQAGSGSRPLTKGVLLDRVVDVLRDRGESARRGVYIDDFIFDIVIDNGDAPSVLEVLSFAAPRKDWTPVERDAAHFLYAVNRLGVEERRAVIQPPADERGAAESYDRVSRWLRDENVPTLAPDELAHSQLALT